MKEQMPTILESELEEANWNRCIETREHDFSIGYNNVIELDGCEFDVDTYSIATEISDSLCNSFIIELDAMVKQVAEEQATSTEMP